MATLQELCDVRGGVHSTITHGRTQPWTAQLRYQRRQVTIDYYPQLDHPSTVDALAYALRMAYLGDLTFQQFGDATGWPASDRDAMGDWVRCQQVSRDLRHLFGASYEYVQGLER